VSHLGLFLLEKQMSKLINEYPLVFLPSLACEYGLNEAIVIQQIHYWSDKVKPSQDGFVWVYNTIPEWKKQFPFWSERTIFSILKKLKELEILFAEKKNENSWNHTLYYRINYEKLGHTISQPLQDRSRKVCENTVNTETTREYIDRFEIFWKKYPKKVSKPSALKSWSKMKPSQELLEKMLIAIDQQGLPSRDMQFVPNPSTWLNNERWEDQVTAKLVSKIPYWMKGGQL
jgi:DNA polymerase III gamma/tau subunit